MSGLLLTNYYMVSRSFWGYLALSVFLSALFIALGNDFLLSFALFIPIIFMVSPALEVLKHEAKSGWGKFVLTTPVNRGNVVQSHYLLFLLFMLVGMVVATVVFVVGDFINGGLLTWETLYTFLGGIAVALLLAVIAFPLTYFLGTEKSDMVLIMSVFAALALFFLSSWAFEEAYARGWMEPFSSWDSGLVFSGGMLAVTLVLFVISFFVAMGIYKRKEF
ncbi:ABC-2 transporter permease [Shouchella sp. JSM 1781072]|uniref:ABC-2 transporter permease n=1 Tax=Shouchella sp. JSM 1781072 TaxID=3344581 RepID=UPI0035C19695